MNAPNQPPDATPDLCPACNNEVTLDAVLLAGDAPCSHCGQLVWFAKKSIGDVAVLTFLPGLMSGSESAGRVEEVIAAIGESSRLVLNLTHMNIISSEFLGMLLALRQEVLRANGTLKLCGLPPDSLDVFKVTKFDTVFDICDDVPNAVRSF